MDTTFALATCSLALLLTVLALVREVRLRRALQRLLLRLLTHWRTPHAKTPRASPTADRPGPADRRL